MRDGMRILRALLTASIPVAIALAAFLNAKALSALVEGTLSRSTFVAEAHASGAALVDTPAPRPEARSANPILDRNPFDHATGSLRVTECAPGSAPPGGCGLDAAPRVMDPRTAPLCETVRSLVVVGNEDQNVAFAALDVGGQRLLRKRGGDIGGSARVAYVGRDRVWIEGPQGLCQAPLFGRAAPLPRSEAAAHAETTTSTTLETEVASRILKTGPNEYAVDRSAVDRLLEAQQELMKHRMVPEKEGDRVVGMRILGIKPGSLLTMLGIANGDRLETLNGSELSNPEKMLEAYARLRTGAIDKLSLHLTRGGKPINVDYVVR